MKKVTSLLLALTFLSGLGFSALNAGEGKDAGKCGAGKCGDGGKDAAGKCGAGKCGDGK